MVKPTKDGSVAAAACYICTAVALVLFNKSVLGGNYTVHLPALIPLVQQVVICVGLVALSRFGMIEKLPKVSLKTLSVMFPVSIAFLFYLILGMMALRRVSIPMYSSLRKFTVLFVMTFDFFISNLTHSKNVHVMVAVQMIGCLMAAVNDLEYNPSGYAFITLYNASTAIYLVVIKHVRTGHDFLNNFSMMFLNSVMLIPALTLLSFFMGDFDELSEFEHRYELGFVVSFFASAILAFVLNYAIFWNTSANSALTQTVSGQVKDIGTVLLGYIAFPPDQLNLLNVCGICLGMVGSLGYAFVKFKESQVPATKK